MSLYFSHRNIAMTVAPDKPPIMPCSAAFDPLTGLLNVNKHHSWRRGAERLKGCRLCGKTRKELRA